LQGIEGGDLLGIPSFLVQYFSIPKYLRNVVAGIDDG
jgi:hypothetical protein